MKRKAVVLIAILLSCPSYGAIQPLVVDLPGLTGAYAFSSTKTAAFDLGQPISFDIGCVSLRIEGSYAGGCRVD